MNIRYSNLNEIKDYGIVYNMIVAQFIKYVQDNNIKALVLGISGGIDSSVCAVICRDVAKAAGCKFIGRSLTIWNKEEEYSTAAMIGNVFVNDFAEVNLKNEYETVEEVLNCYEGIYSDNKIAYGNIQARLRMNHLYFLSNINKGIVIDTDNLTENCLGFFTIHGDQGDYKPIGGLWKTEVYSLADYILNNICETYEEKEAMKATIGILPTDGLGISNTDVEQFGAKDYNQVDDIFHKFFEMINQNSSYYKTQEFAVNCYLNAVKGGCDGIYDVDYNVADNILHRYINTEYKRKSIPVVNIYDN